MGASIGIIGGVGPYAGVDILRKIFDNTIASSDQEHLDVYLTNIPSKINDRTTFLLEGGENPAEGLFTSFEKLARIGSTVIVIPCNTAHAPAIYGELKQRAAKRFEHVQLLNMIEETCSYIATQFPQGAKIGLLATKGTHAVGVYQQYISQYPTLELIEPSMEGQERVHSAIYDPKYGVKAVSPVHALAVEILIDQCNKLIERGVSAIVLGCTELPIALQDGMVPIPFIDPTLLLARAAIQAVDPQRLR